MASVKVFAVRDVAAEAFNSAFCVVTASLAIRGFVQAVKDERTELSKYPDSFVLYEVGEFDQVSGVLKGFDSPKRLMSGLEALEVK